MGHFLFTIIIYPLYTLIECIYTFFDRFTDNTGFCVIGVSVGVTLLCLPLYAVAEHWQEVERDKQLSMKNGLDRIKKAFSGDERYMMTTTFYRQNHYSPLMALRSSFGLLIQVPFFLAAYTFLSHLPALSGRSFLFIRDMGAQDALFRIGSFPINVLPIAMTLINIVSGLIYTKGFPLKDKIMPFAMALIFLIILYPSPSGLVLYWTFNNIFSLVKNIFYKLKNPLKSFWLFCCVALIPFSVLVLFFTTTKWKYKAVYIFLLAVIYLLPVILKKVSYLLNTFFAPVVADKALRVKVYLASCVVLFLLTGFVIPSSLISSSPIEFANIGAHPNPLYYMFNTALQSAGIFFFWAVCIFFLFNAQVQTVLTIAIASLALCGVVNAYLFMLPYGDISSSLNFLNSSTDFRTVSLIALVNLAVVVALIVGISFAARIRKGSVLSSLALILSLSFAAVSVANSASINKTYSEYAASGVQSTAAEIEPIFHLSKTQPNIVVMMLDRAEGKYIHDIMTESPDLRDSYSGFVHYNNTIAFNSHTLQGNPGLFGGYEYTPLSMNRRTEETLRDKQNQALLVTPRILTEEKGFTAVLTDPSWANYSDYMDLSIVDPYPAISGYQLAGKYSTLWYAEHNDGESLDNTEFVLKRNLLFFSFFRAAPVVIRELVYKKGTYWNPDEHVTGGKVIMDWYAGLDYLRNLTDITDKDSGSYVCMVNEFTHENYFLQAPDYVPVKTVTNYGPEKHANASDYHTAIGAFKRIGTWLEYLKENGVYDNTRIILVSDHGNIGDDEYMEPNPALDDAVYGGRYYGRGRFHPILLVKDFNATGSLQEDDTTFMTNADVISLVLNGIVEHPVNPFTKQPIPLDTTALKKDGVIISINDKHVPLDHGKYTFNIRKDQWWHVQDNIFKAENWKQVYPFGE